MDRGAELLRIGLVGAELQRAVASGDERGARRALTELGRLLGEVAALAPLPASAPRSALQFICDTVFLRGCYDFLCGPFLGKDAPFRESFHFVGGGPLDPGRLTLSHLVPVEFSQQWAAGVQVADGSNRDALAWLDSVGLVLAGHFHTHPGGGPPSPSATDYAFQQRLERGGHVGVGGIFTTDGFLRFFACDPRRFSVRIIGTIEEVDREQHLYRLPLAERQLSLSVPRRRS